MVRFLEPSLGNRVPAGSAQQAGCFEGLVPTSCPALKAGILAAELLDPTGSAKVDNHLSNREALSC